MNFRLFFGIPFPEATEAIDLAKSAVVTQVKWTKAENLHITLLFLGSVDEKHLDSIIQAGEINSGRFIINAEKLSIKNKHMVWLELKESKEATALHKELEERIQAVFPLKKEERKFRPHVTLARSRDKIKTSGIPALKEFDREVDSYILYRSVQGNEGTEYIPLKTYQLKRV